MTTNLAVKTTYIYYLYGFLWARNLGTDYLSPLLQVSQEATIKVLARIEVSSEDLTGKDLMPS